MTLFGDDEPAEILEPAPGGERAPKWSAIGGRQRCDLCVVLAARDPQHTFQPARWRRVTATSDDRYCYPHARPVREHDDAVAERLNRKAS